MSETQFLGIKSKEPKKIEKQVIIPIRDQFGIEVGTRTLSRWDNGVITQEIKSSYSNIHEPFEDPEKITNEILNCPNATELTKSPRLNALLREYSYDPDKFKNDPIKPLLEYLKRRKDFNIREKELERKQQK